MAPIVFFSVLFQRLFITSFVTLIVVAVVRWLISPSEAVWLVQRWVQALWIGLLTLWAFAVRVGLRRGFLVPDSPKLFLFSLKPQEFPTILYAWRRVPQRQVLRPLDAGNLAFEFTKSDEPLMVAISQGVSHDPSLRSFLSYLESSDPRHVRSLSVLSLFEQHQERVCHPFSWQIPFFHMPIFLGRLHSVFRLS